jgi:hypothetical protein
MTASDPQLLLRSVRRDKPYDSQQCLNEATIAALVDGTLDDAIHAAAVLHLAQCRLCRSAVTSVSRALGDASIAREIATLARRRRRRFAVAMALSAAAVFLLIALPHRNDGDSQTMRVLPFTNVLPGSVNSGVVASDESLGHVVERIDSGLPFPHALRLTAGRALPSHVEPPTQMGGPPYNVPWG